MATIEDVTDYIIMRCQPVNNLKLQKLLYYTQAWHLAFYGRPLFSGQFQAWIHGPVNREVYDRFKETKSLYSDLGPADVRPGFNGFGLKQEEVVHIGTVVDEYAKYSGSQLEELSHLEDPWRKARSGIGPGERSEAIIDEAHIGLYYAARVRPA